MDRKQTLERAFLFEGFELGGLKIHPLSANRRAFLRIKKNTICDGDGRGLSELEEVAECLFACTKTSKELGSYMLNGNWEDDVLAFTITSEDHVIESFANELMDEAERLKLGAVESLGKEVAQ